MSIKRILAFVLLIILAYVGIYMVIYGAERYMLYSGTERDFNLMSGKELQSMLNVKGSIETVTKLLHEEEITSDILGFTVGHATQYYYVMPIGYQEDIRDQQYCVIAVSNPDDVSTVKGLMKPGPVPLDQNAPRFEFRGIALDMETEVYQKFKAYLQNELRSEDNIHDIIFGAKVDDNLVPYVIYVKSKKDTNFILPISVGGACAVLGIGLFILLAIRTYKKKHMYD